MVKVIYVESNGTEHALDLSPGLSVMRGAVENNVRGILGECGGACQCATCHVYVDPAWFDKVSDISAIEEALLEDVCDGQPNSRLSCQIRLSEALDGLVVRLPARQV